jgi:hypothetical protein
VLLLAYPVWADNLISAGSTDWTAAATWGKAEAGAGAAQLSHANVTNTTVAYVASAAWTCTNLDVLDGVTLFARRLTATGTVTVGFSDDNGVSYTHEVTVNASDLPSSLSWIFFRFGLAYTCDGGADHKIAVKASSAGNASFGRDATAGNWTRLERTTTTKVPAAADAIYVIGELTGAGANTPITVAMNETANTDYGLIEIGHLGTLSLATAGGTNYYLKTSGVLNVWATGTLSLGTVATPLPSTSTFHLHFDCTVNVEFGLVVNDLGALNIQGNPIANVSALLAADAAINDTALTTNIATGWKDNDQIAVASTTRTAGQSEIGALNGDAVGTALTVDGFGGAGGGVAYAHSGTAPTRAEIINLTRNVKIHGASAALQTYIYFANLSTTNVDYAEFYWLGSGTANKRGIDVLTTTGTCDIRYSSLHDFAIASSLGVLLATGGGGLTYSGNVSWNINSQHFMTNGATAYTWTASNSVFIKTVAGNELIWLGDVGGTFSGNTIVSSATRGMTLSEGETTVAFANNTFHSNATRGLFVFQLGSSGSLVSNFASLTIWRNGDYGLYLGGVNGGVFNLVIDGCAAFGNANGNVWAAWLWNVRLNAFTLDSEAAYTTAYGVVLMGSGTEIVYDLGLRLENSSLGVTTPHTTADVWLSSTYLALQMMVRDTALGSAVQVFGTAASLFAVPGMAYIRGQRLGAPGTHKTWLYQGTISSDNVIFHTAAPSERLTPNANSLINKLESGTRRQTVLSGGTATFNVWVRKSVAADPFGANYNGAQPRLVLRSNAALGVDNDTVLDTMAVAIGNWELLTGTTPAATDDGAFEVVIDCDGTLGWINVSEARYWTEGLPAPETGAGGVRRYSIVQ